MKKNGGITLIALVITIIVLLILAGVSINAVIGDNGLIAQAMESRIVTLIADIIFKLEDNIVDINTESILTGKKLIASEVMKELENRNVLLKEETDGLDFFTSSMQQQINENRIKPLYLGFNGDIWYNNYKRGKVNLSSQTNTLYSLDKRTKIAVIDGTVEELKPNYKYYLHSLENRGDFVCWINSYGEIVSNYKDTIIYINVPRDEEFTAVYDIDIKEKLNKKKPSIEEYKEWFVSDVSLEAQYEIGLNSAIVDNNGEIYFEAQVTHNKYTHCFEKDENRTYLNEGIVPISITLYVSDNYDDLTIDTEDMTLEDRLEEANMDCLSYYGVNFTNFPNWSKYYKEDLKLNGITEEEYCKIVEEQYDLNWEYENSWKDEWRKFYDVDHFPYDYLKELETYRFNDTEVEDVPEELREDYKEYVKCKEFNFFYINWDKDPNYETRFYERYKDEQYSLEEYESYREYYDWYTSDPYRGERILGYWNDENKWIWKEISWDDFWNDNYDEDDIYIYELWSDPSFFTVPNYNESPENIKDVFKYKYQAGALIDDPSGRIPIIDNEDNLKYVSDTNFVSHNITEFLNDFKDDYNCDRIYYRVEVDYTDMVNSTWDSFNNSEVYYYNEEGEADYTDDFHWYEFGDQSDYDLKEYYSPVIKYIDL